MPSPDLPDIFFCGDPHGQFDHIIDAVLTHRPAAVVLLGDMDCPLPLEQLLAPIAGKAEIGLIPGNHDTDHADRYDNLANCPFVHLHQRVATLAGVRIAGLGGVFRGKVWDPRGEPAVDPQRSPEAFLATMGKGNRWRGGLALRQRSTIFPSMVAALAAQRADVLVTHEAPGWHQHGFEVLGELAAAMGVAHAFHGHHHRDVDYAAEHGDPAAALWHGVGVRGITSLAGKVIVPGAYEASRPMARVCPGP